MNQAIYLLLSILSLAIVAAGFGVTVGMHQRIRERARWTMVLQRRLDVAWQIQRGLDRD